MNKLKIIISRILLCHLFVIAGSVFADAAETGANIELAGQVGNIIERNQANLDSVKTMQGIVRIEMKTDYGEQGISHIIETEKFWFDGSCLRSDILNNEQAGRGEPLVVERSGGQKSLVTGREKGMVEIKTSESRHVYQPRTKNVFIFPRERDDRDLRRTFVMMSYQLINGTPLKETILKNAGKEKEFDCTVTSDTVDGDECLLLEYNYSSERVRKIWIVPSKGYCIRKHQSLSKGLLYNEFITTLKEYSPGIWWLNTVKARESLGGRLNYNVNVTVDSLTFNEPVDPNIFTLAGTNIPHGTRVYDQITGKSYNHINIPSPPGLIGKPLPNLKDFGIELSVPDANDKSLFVCFFDMNQRPSRNCIVQLGRMAQQLKAKGIIVVAVQASKVEREKLDEWLKDNSIALSIGVVESGTEEAMFNWGVKSLPWLILTDRRQIVRAEGFNINELDEKITILTER